MGRTADRQHGGPWRGLPRLRCGRGLAVLLLSGINDVPRVHELQRVAVEVQDNIEGMRSESDTNLRELVNDDGDELDPLF